MAPVASGVSNIPPYLDQLVCLAPLSPSDKKHVDWVKAYLSIWTELQVYIKEYHTTGLTWSKTVSTG